MVLFQVSIFLFSKISIGVSYFACNDITHDSTYAKRMTKMFFRPIGKDTTFDIIFGNGSDDKNQLMFTGDFSIKDLTLFTLHYTFKTITGYVHDTVLDRVRLKDIREALAAEIRNVLFKVNIKTYPDNAILIIDKDSVLSPYKHFLLRGKYRIKVLKPGYQDMDTVIDVNKNKDFTLILSKIHSSFRNTKEGNFSKDSAFISIRFPYEGELYIKGKFFTLLRNGVFESIPVGNYDISIYNVLYGERDYKIKVKRGDTVYVSFTP